VTAQNTLGVQGVVELPPDFVAKQFDSVLSDIGTQAAKTGMLSSVPLVQIVSQKLREHQLRQVVVDPVMVAKVAILCYARRPGRRWWKLCCHLPWL